MRRPRTRLWLGLALVVASVGAASAPGAEVSFAPPVDLPVDLAPVALAAEASVSGAERATIALVGAGPATVVMLHTDDTGRVVASERALLPAGSSPNSVVLSDLDRDGQS